MRLTLFLIFACNLAINAQKSGQIFSFDIYYGFRTQFQDFYHQLNTINDFNLKQPLQTVGVGLSGNFVITSNGNFDGHFIFNQVIPQTIYVEDTLKAKITGFVFSFACGKAFMTESEKFALTYYLGFNSGRLRIYGNESLKQKNPFFSPKIGIQPKIRFGKIAFTMTLEYDYDISKTTWKPTRFSNGEKYTLITLRQTAFTGLFGIGYILE